METTVIVQGVIDNVIKKQTKSGTDYFKIQVASYAEDGTKRLGDIVTYEDRGFKVGQEINCLCFQKSRIYNDRIYTDTQLLKKEKEDQKMIQLRAIIGNGNGPGGSAPGKAEKKELFK